MKGPSFISELLIDTMVPQLYGTQSRVNEKIKRNITRYQVQVTVVPSNNNSVCVVARLVIRRNS